MAMYEEGRVDEWERLFEALDASPKYQTAHGRSGLLYTTLSERSRLMKYLALPEDMIVFLLNRYLIHKHMGGRY